MGTLGPSFLPGVKARFELVAEPADDNYYFGVHGFSGCARKLLEAFKLATRAHNVGPQIIDCHRLKVGQEDAGWLVVTLSGHRGLRSSLGAPIVDDAGLKARAFRPCLRACKQPQSGPKHRLGEMSTSLWILKGSLTSTGLSLINEFVK